MANPPRQDMPPAGGYQDFNWNRTFPRTWFKPGRVLAITVGITGYGVYWYWYTRARIITEKFEDIDVRCAYEPFMKAERDRNWLKLLRDNRDIENDLMKDVPGWKTGTWYGEPVYFTLGDKWWDPTRFETMAHSEFNVSNRHIMWKHHSEYAGPHWYDKFMPEVINKYIW